MQNKKNVISNAIICSILCILGFLVSTLNVKQTYLTIAAPLSNGNRNSQQIGLMFIIDEPELANNLPNILDTLGKAEATATFFFTGTAAINNLEILQTLAQQHEIGNYGFSNTSLNLADKNAIYEEIRLSDALFKSLVKVKMKVFTPPAGNFNRHTIAMASNLGYTTVLPTNRDAVINWDQADSNVVLSYATYNIKNGDIIALKPTVATLQSFAQIIAHYTTNDWGITSLSRLLQV